MIRLLSPAPGTRLGPYEIIAPIGAGGMGEVYRARDTKLDRDVAIKVLPESFALDDDRIARFTREAKTLAALNHPNIAQIYGIESNAPLDGARGAVSDSRTALVMELVEGDDLSAIIARGAIPVADALPIAKQIADALEAAHEQGIIHRDLKPQNVKVKADGTVKVLDFGLAKAIDPSRSSGQAINSPTMTAHATQMGMIIGTAAYMSPEQARGRSVDRRADIWAFGVVLFEMLSGRRAFEGDEITDVLASVLRQDIDWTALPAHTPARLRRLLERCLDRDPKQRLRDIGEARVEIAKIENGAPDTTVIRPAAAEASTRSPRLPWLIAGALALVSLVMLALWAPWNAAAPDDRRGVVHLTMALEGGDELSTNLSAIASATDGQHVAYVTAGKGKAMLAVRAINKPTGKMLEGTEGAESPFFSPDGQWIGFFAGGKLKKIATGGAALQVLADAPFERGGAWAGDGYIYFAPTNIGGIWRVPEGGGVASQVTEKNMSAGEISHRWPHITGNTLLFGMWTGPGNDEHNIAVHTLDSKGHRVLVKGGDSPRYAAKAGLLVYVRLGGLFVVPWTPSQHDLGRAVPIATGERVKMFGQGESVANYAISDDGTLIYVAGGRGHDAMRLVWVDRTGHQEFPVFPDRDYERVVISPNGREAIVEVREGKISLWTYDIDRSTMTQIGPNAGSSQAPIFTPDGLRVIYRSTQSGLRNLFWRRVDGSGGEERLLSKAEVFQTPTSVSPDGQWVVFNESGAGEIEGVGIWVVRLDGDYQAHRLFQPGAGEEGGHISPNGRWIAFDVPVSNRREIFVAPFPGPGPRHQVSTGGGQEALWSHDGRELFFQAGTALMSASVSAGAELSLGQPRALYEGRYMRSVNGTTGFAVTNDSKRFLRVQTVDPERAVTSLNVVLNWFAEAKSLVAGK